MLIQENEDTLQKIIYELQKISNNYNFNISTTKTKVMGFQGKYPIRSKIILNKNQLWSKSPTLITYDVTLHTNMMI
jgi:hypothetical protein